MTENWPMLCYACGRALSNDPKAENFGLWTEADPAWPYCAGDDFCQRITLADHATSTTT